MEDNESGTLSLHIALLIFQSTSQAIPVTITAILLECSAVTFEEIEVTVITCRIKAIDALSF